MPPLIVILRICTAFWSLTAYGITRFTLADTNDSGDHTMEKLIEVLTMGGYAAYVWPSFIIAALAMLCMVLTSMRSLKRAQHTLAELQKTASLTGQNET